ncbi:MAG: MBL fold metallo-hydrolase [Zoogloea sp.]|nr:MBL fold metallo-hydrolase [Zoogloea sp.]
MSAPASGWNPALNCDMPVLLRQFLDGSSATLSYLLADLRSREAVIIDPVHEHVPLYLGVLGELGLKLTTTIDTHVHSDHLSGSASLKRLVGARIAIGRHAGASGADLLLSEGDSLALGGEKLEVIETPGHTRGCISLRWQDRLFTGDALLIGSCGDADSPGADAGLLYDTLTRKILRFPDETLIYPGHLLSEQRVSCVGEERVRNWRIRGVSRDEFAARMATAPRPLVGGRPEIAQANSRYQEEVAGTPPAA